MFEDDNINLHRCLILLVSGIIVDEEVEEEVEGSMKWTDRTLMLQHGLLTAVEVEEDGDQIQRIRGRLVSYPSR